MTSNEFEGAPGNVQFPGASQQQEQSLAGMLDSLLGGARNQLATEQVEGMAGGGAVRVIMDGEQNVLDVKLSPEVVDPNEIGMLEELIVSAMADAARQAQEVKLRSVSALAEMFGLGDALGGPSTEVGP